MKWEVLPLHVVGEPSASRARTVEAAAKTLGLGLSVRYSPDLAAARLRPWAGREVLVLLDAVAGDLEAALLALDPRGLPRWAVVPSSPDEASQPDFAATEWQVSAVARSIHFAVTLLKWRRENVRLRGDLCTVGRRLSHDLRTPLQSIRAANEAMSEPAIARDGAADLQRAIADAVNDASVLMHRLGVILLASARPVILQRVAMDEIAWNARQSVEPQARSSSATIVAPEKWPTVNGVPALLELAWANLLLHSLQYAEGTPRIEMGWTSLEKEMRFWVRDNGPGAKMARGTRLFHPVDRLHELDAPRRYELSIVQRVIELQSGVTGYSEEPAPGGSYFFTLPDPDATA